MLMVYSVIKQYDGFRSQLNVMVFVLWVLITLVPSLQTPSLVNVV